LQVRTPLLTEMTSFKAHSIMRRLVDALLFAIVLTIGQFCVSASVAQSPFSQTELKATHGAWQVRCIRPAGAKAEKCGLFQWVQAADRENFSLTIIFLRSFSGDKKRLRVVAPLDVILPAGVGLKIDDQDIGKARFLKCSRTGCVADVAVDDALVEKLRNGQTAIFIVFKTFEEGIAVPIDLSGFGDGLRELN